MIGMIFEKRYAARWPLKNGKHLTFDKRFALQHVFFLQRHFLGAAWEIVKRKNEMTYSSIVFFDGNDIYQINHWLKNIFFANQKSQADHKAIVSPHTLWEKGNRDIWQNVARQKVSLPLICTAWVAQGSFTFWWPLTKGIPKSLKKGRPCMTHHVQIWFEWGGVGKQFECLRLGGWRTGKVKVTNMIHLLHFFVILVWIGVLVVSGGWSLLNNPLKKGKYKPPEIIL